MAVDGQVITIQGFCVFLPCIFSIADLYSPIMNIFASFTEALPLPWSCLRRSSPLHDK